MGRRIGLPFPRVYRAAVLAATLSGCTIIDAHRGPPEDWPPLAVVERRASFLDVQRACNPDMPLLASLLVGVYLGCARIHFDASLCEVWLLEDADAATAAHERMHCAGFDHIGGSVLRHGWSEYKGRRQ
jgi:hypothetical protein